MNARILLPMSHIIGASLKPPMWLVVMRGQQQAVMESVFIETSEHPADGSRFSVTFEVGQGSSLFRPGTHTVVFEPIQDLGEGDRVLCSTDDGIPSNLLV